MNASEPVPPAPRQRFPTKKQALVGCFGTLILSFTTCMSLIVLFGEKQLSDSESFLFLLVLYVCTFAPLGGFVLLIMYFVRRRSEKRQERQTS